jgi:hypothetical protein
MSKNIKNKLEKPKTCEVCGKPMLKTFLFLPSNRWVRFCEYHFFRVSKKDPDMPIDFWLENEKDIL